MSRIKISDYVKISIAPGKMLNSIRYFADKDNLTINQFIEKALGNYLSLRELENKGSSFYIKDSEGTEREMKNI